MSDFYRIPKQKPADRKIGPVNLEIDHRWQKVRLWFETSNPARIEYVEAETKMTPTECRRIARALMDMAVWLDRNKTI